MSFNGRRNADAEAADGAAEDKKTDPQFITSVLSVLMLLSSLKKCIKICINLGAAANTTLPPEHKAVNTDAPYLSQVIRGVLFRKYTVCTLRVR